MSADYIVIGHFRYVDDTKSAIVKLREMGHKQLELFSPVPNHDLEDELYREEVRSPVRRFTLTGAVTGCLGAFLMTIWMSRDWPVWTSAKGIVSIPAFVIIAFECTILLGGIFTLLGLFHNCRIPNLFRPVAFRPVFTKDIFGLTVRVSKDESERIKDELKRCGAEEVEVQYVR